MPYCWHSSILFSVAVLAWLAPPAYGQERLNDDNAVAAGKGALSGAARFPWYDRSRDEVRRLNLAPRGNADSRNRGSQWTDTSATTSTPGRMASLGAFGYVLQWVGLTVLVLVLGLIAYLVATTFLQDEVSEGASLRKLVESARDVDRVEALPFQIRKPTGDFLSEARRLYEAGYYSEAIIYLFSYQLVQLDRRHLIRLAKGKTNRQYVREVRQRPTVRSILERTMFAFEDAFFGRKTLSRERFESCWQRLDEFHAELDRLERAAA
jgi:Domain of unknown function (DUF4129)